MPARIVDDVDFDVAAAVHVELRQLLAARVVLFFHGSGAFIDVAVHVVVGHVVLVVTVFELRCIEHAERRSVIVFRYAAAERRCAAVRSGEEGQRQLAAIRTPVSCVHERQSAVGRIARR